MINDEVIQPEDVIQPVEVIQSVSNVELVVPWTQNLTLLY